MRKRYLSIYLCYLQTDWVSNRQPGLKGVPFVLSVPDHGRMVVAAVNKYAQEHGIDKGMVVADARAICPGIAVLDNIPGLVEKLVRAFALWCIRFTPVAAMDLPDGIILDITGCAHLWGGEEQYAEDITKRIRELGYHVRFGIADTIGAAWAVARFATNNIVVPGGQQEIIRILPPAALRLPAELVERLHKLGLKHIGQFMQMPSGVLRRRFGDQIILRLQQALGYVEEIIQPVAPVVPYQERLPCLEPIATATGIRIALEELLARLCDRLVKEGKGIRSAKFSCYRVDNHVQHIEVGTHRASQKPGHLFRLFEEKIQTIQPDLGIELFTLEAIKVDNSLPAQEKLWENTYGLESAAIAELIDRVANKLGSHTIHRYLPDAHYWPERSAKLAASIAEKADNRWPVDRPGPLQLLSVPQPVQVAAPIPDYPPMLFRYRGRMHNIKKADGPERIEQEWWLEQGEHRDYYIVEDEAGCRYWIFRLGHYDPNKNNQWFLHGYFA